MILNPTIARLRESYVGWNVLAACFVCSMLAVGCTIYLFGVFVVPLTREFGISRTEANNGLILMLIGMAVWSPLAGRLLDRLPARRVIGTGALLFSAGFITIALSSSLPVIAAAIAGPIALGVTCAGGLAANTVAVRWFRRRRGRAMGILAVSTSTGGFVLMPTTALLIEQLGWRTAMLTVGVVVGVVLALLAVLVIRDRPDSDDRGYADEFGDGGNGEAAGAERSWSFRQLLGDRNFWCVTLGAGLLLASDQAVLASKVPYFQDAGISLSAAAVIAACMTGSAIAGKLLVGALADRVDLRLLFGLVVICHVCLLAVFIIQPGYWTLLLVGSVVGMAVGGVYPVWMTLTAAVFGAKTYGTVMGAMAVMMQPLSVVAIRFIGEVYDRTGSYDAAFATFIGVVCAAFGLIVLVRRPIAEPAGAGAASAR